MDTRMIRTVADTLNNGGATFHRDGSPVTFGPVRRYVVGGVDGFRLSVPAASLQVRDIGTVVEQNPSCDTFGTWIDPDTSMVDIEPVEILTNLDTAMAFARERGERAIWDAVEQREIWVQQEEQEEQDVAVRFRIVGDAGRVDALIAAVANALGV